MCVWLFPIFEGNVLRVITEMLSYKQGIAADDSGVSVANTDACLRVCRNGGGAGPFALLLTACSKHNWS
jgi:hypothetical protein